ncbi:MAG: condensation domain-containing protein [Bacillota bacterium]|nr:condensation domain-containing protein [Bacillota bacterium]
MKLVFKFGDTKIKIPYEDLENYFDVGKIYKMFSDMYKTAENPFFNLFPSSVSPGKDMNGNVLSNLMNYYNNVNKAYQNHTKNSFGEDDNEDILPVNGHDIYNYVARYGIANCQIQAIMTLDGKLDNDKLSKAVRLSFDAEPVFGCRFVENNPPFWKRRDDLDKIVLCTLEENNNTDQAVKRFLDSPLNMDTDPMVKLRLIRSEQNDVLALKVNHACCDGTGVKEYIQLLADIYSIIDENKDYVSEPRNRTRSDQDRLFESLGITDLDSAFVPGSEILLPTWPFPWQQDSSNCTHMEIRKLSELQFEKISEYAKSRGATINDLILTAFYRAMFDMGKPVYGYPMEIPVTVDLRRYLPEHRTEAIRNFSGSVNTQLSMKVNETFDETLSRVIPVMREIKSGYPGVQSAIGLERIEKMSFDETLAYYQVNPKAADSDEYPVYGGDKCVPTLSNLGYVSKSLIRFGKNIVNDASIISPVVRAPGILLMISTYNGTVTMSMGYYEKSIHRSDINTLLDRVKNELVEFADSPK